MRLLFRILQAAALFFLLLHSSCAAEDKPIVIVHARIIDGLGGAPVEDGTVIPPAK